MILVTRLNGKQVYLNPELIQTVEETPDTVITLLDRSKLVVKEPARVVAELYIEYRRKAGHPPFAQPEHLKAASGDGE